ncbi:hypothetical protein F5146DRAFT_1004038 [Armillaria mellea]|nr:hypothetical protein F5146DRAFT_1004038 [Armillaria mellea]
MIILDKIQGIIVNQEVTVMVMADLEGDRHKEILGNQMMDQVTMGVAKTEIDDYHQIEGHQIIHRVVTMVEVVAMTPQTHQICHWRMRIVTAQIMMVQEEIDTSESTRHDQSLMHDMIEPPDAYMIKTKFMCGIPNAMAVDIFEEGLTVEGSTMLELLAVACRYECTHYSINQFVRPSGSTSRLVESKRHEQKVFEGKQQLIKKTIMHPIGLKRDFKHDWENTKLIMHQNKPIFVKQRPDKGKFMDNKKLQVGATNKEGKCFGCGGQGHWANDPNCPNYRKLRPMERMRAAHSVIEVDGVEYTVVPSDNEKEEREALPEDQEQNNKDEQLLDEQIENKDLIYTTETYENTWRDDSASENEQARTSGDEADNEEKSMSSDGNEFTSEAETERSDNDEPDIILYLNDISEKNIQQHISALLEEGEDVVIYPWQSSEQDYIVYITAGWEENASVQMWTKRVELRVMKEPQDRPKYFPMEK